MHIGGLRTALYAYALAKHSRGQFLLRIEDTDLKREVVGATEALKKTLVQFGLGWDELYIQSHRAQTGVYREAAARLVSAGQAFYCQCPPKNAKQEGYSQILRDPCRDQGLTSGAVKLKIPGGRTVTYHDFVHEKDISWDTDTVYDATLLKSDGMPTYHLAAMVDDLEMRITHILRGHDWLPSTPIHLLVFEFLGGNRPEIGHLTDILSSETGKKLSKRRDSVFVEQFLKQGYLPEALLNFVMLLGWAPKDNRELFTLTEFVGCFDSAGFQQANPRFFAQKLDWFNGQYIRAKTPDELVELLRPFTAYDLAGSVGLQAVSLVRDRLTRLAEFDQLAGFFFAPPRPDPAVWPDATLALKHLQGAHRVISALPEFFQAACDAALQVEVKSQGGQTGDFFMSLRIAICGSRFTPPLTPALLILGKDEVLKRIQTAIDALKPRT